MSGLEDNTRPAEGQPEGAPKRTRNRTKTPGRGRHPLLAGRPQGVWYPDAVGVVRGYPKSQEAFDAKLAVLRANSEGARKAGKLNRHGVPDGWAGQKQQIREAHVTAAETASAVVALMIAEKRWKPDTREGRLAMEAVLHVAFCAACHTNERLTAMRIILEYTQAPAARRQQIEAAPMAWLEELARDAMKGS